VSVFLSISTNARSPAGTCWCRGFAGVGAAAAA
jgi:hypothetical protein